MTPAPVVLFRPFNPTKTESLEFAVLKACTRTLLQRRGSPDGAGTFAVKAALVAVTKPRDADLSAWRRDRCCVRWGNIHRPIWQIMEVVLQTMVCAIRFSATPCRR